MGHLTRQEFESLSLFEAHDLEHAAMISAGLATRWPEEIRAEDEAIADEVRAIVQTRMTRAKGGRHHD